MWIGGKTSVSEFFANGGGSLFLCIICVLFVNRRKDIGFGLFCKRRRVGLFASIFSVVIVVSTLINSFLQPQFEFQTFCTASKFMCDNLMIINRGVQQYHWIVEEVDLRIIGCIMVYFFGHWTAASEDVNGGVQNKCVLSVVPRLIIFHFQVTDYLT